MIELFTRKQICCEHCGFGFIYTGYCGAASIVCPACGESNELPPTSSPETAREEVAESDNLAASTSLSEFIPPVSSDPLPQIVPEKSSPCSVEQCPLLTGNDTGSERSTAKAITEEMGVRVLKRKKRRKNIFAWTVTLQICVLLGTLFFIVQSYWILPKPTVYVAAVDSIQNVAVQNEELLSVDLPPQIPAAPQFVPVEETVTLQFPASNNEPVVPIDRPEVIVDDQAATAYAIPQTESVQDIFPPPVHDYSLSSSSPFDSSIVEPSTPALNTEPSVIPPPLPSEPAVTPVTLEMADILVKSSEETLATNPESSLEQAVRAAKIYEELGSRYPDSLYWILGNAFASLSWGEPLLESSPVVETMTLSPDNRYLLLQLADKKVWLWDLKTQSADPTGYVLDQGSADYVKFIFTTDLRWIIGGQKNGTIRIWDMSLKNPADTVITFTERIPDLQDIQISPNGQWLAAFGHAPRSLMVSKKQSNGSVQQVNYQRSDRDTVSAAPYPVLLWNLRQMETGIMPLATLIPSMPQPAQVVRFSPNSDRIAIGRKDAVARVYDLTPRGVNEDPFILRGHQLGITQIAFAPSGQWLATGSQDNTVRLWNLTSSKVSPESATLNGHVGWIKTLNIDSTGEYLFSGSYDRTIRIWNIKYNRIGTALKNDPLILETNQGIPDMLMISPDNDKMIILSNDGSLGIYHLPSLLSNDPKVEQRAITFRNSKLSISKCQMTSDNQFLIFSYDHIDNHTNNGIRLWSLQTKSLIP